MLIARWTFQGVELLPLHSKCCRARELIFHAQSTYYFLKNLLYGFSSFIHGYSKLAVVTRSHNPGVMFLQRSA